MSENPLQSIVQTFEKISQNLQTHFSQLVVSRPNSLNHNNNTTTSTTPLFSISNTESTLSESSQSHFKTNNAQPVSKEELGRATWTFLHTLGAQFPDKPTRQQKKDVKELMAILSRIYPCKECADHFKDVLRANPVEAGSQAEFSQWLCRTHNVVNRSLGKLVFPCERVDARWGKLDCEQPRACDLQGSTVPWQ
ncbi:Sulfhydryl oxidase [Heracleum sosnowskyi]|uniref:Sulfhydryl oxidase n=1 Tax=Heracleum sosnowskyi TaxID=360622 RepID=A0AAD8H235_9APIA|nr:Sulfhydryl oxidase [Heracleum sosnowskyi]